MHVQTGYTARQSTNAARRGNAALFVKTGRRTMHYKRSAQHAGDLYGRSKWQSIVAKAPLFFTHVLVSTITEGKRQVVHRKRNNSRTVGLTQPREDKHVRKHSGKYGTQTLRFPLCVSEGWRWRVVQATSV